MGTTTANALPYPEATDPVAAGAAAIEALARAIDPKLAPATAIVHVVAPGLGSDALSPVDGSTEWLGVDLAWPTWAKYANVTTSLHGVSATTADCFFTLRLRVGAAGSSGGALGSEIRFAPNSTAGTIAGMTWTDRFALTGLPTRRYSLLVGRIVGTGQLRATNNSSLRFQTIYEY